MTYKQPGVGSTSRGDGNYYTFGRRIVIGFDDDTFEEIRKRAIHEQTSFAAQVRDLVEWGLETCKK